MGDDWLRYAAPDQRAGLRGIDREAVPWQIVPEVAFCPRCLGALPSTSSGACSVCSTDGVDGPDLLYPQAVERQRLSVSPWDGFRAVGCG